MAPTSRRSAPAAPPLSPHACSRAMMRGSLRSWAPACRGWRTWRPFHASATSRRSASLRATPTAPKIWPNAVCTPCFRPSPRGGSRDSPLDLDLDDARRHDIDDARRLDLALRHGSPIGMDVPVHGDDWLEVLNQAKDGDKADVG